MTMMSIAAPLYRQATAADIPAMSAIRLAVTENVLSDPSRVTLAMYEDYLERSGHGWVAELDGTVVAFCYAARDGSIWALFVQPGCEGRGLAQRLLALATDWLFAQGHECIRLSTAAGTRADRFYAAQGWRRSECADRRNLDYVLERPSTSEVMPRAASRAN
jgi:GNAT superfamily N-acetyltransferase